MGIPVWTEPVKLLQKITFFFFSGNTGSPRLLILFPWGKEKQLFIYLLLRWHNKYVANKIKNKVVPPPSGKFWLICFPKLKKKKNTKQRKGRGSGYIPAEGKAVPTKAVGPQPVVDHTTTYFIMVFLCTSTTYKTLCWFSPELLLP